ncbi:hypothetical protein AOQ84DRAFT_229036 [Glonium stellatum]|uniref:Uncharacterized protein n=1 Tax=Glonium stellatum TaxID=574774 RepID=A0A8E2EPG5_9PEZI|nr:hypothetical protein AOQ84DRAFT_229036 [Glonium stellatum]
MTRIVPPGSTPLPVASFSHPYRFTWLRSKKGPNARKSGMGFFWLPGLPSESWPRKLLTLPSGQSTVPQSIVRPDNTKGQVHPVNSVKRPAACERASKSARASAIAMGQKSVTQAADAREAERHLRHGRVQFQSVQPEACDGVERQKGLARRRDAERCREMQIAIPHPVRNELRRRTWASLHAAH